MSLEKKIRRSVQTIERLQKKIETDKYTNQNIRDLKFEKEFLDFNKQLTKRNNS